MSRFHTNWVNVISLGVILVSNIVLVILVPRLVSSLVVLSTPDASIPELESGGAVSATPTDSPGMAQARAVLARMRNEIAPREGKSTDYGVTFSDLGYETLVGWNADVELEDRFANAYESLDLLLPCCDWSTPSRDESRNCRCGHHQALEGLSKELLSRGWDSRAVEGEVTLWNRYLFPKEAVRVEMEKRAPLDPDVNAALEELKARGEC
ncbi:MAG: hypothetical protein M1482_05655 [Chloroflexi bacterium]|nr:hypothetical protein [Chloroflexota bacterium]